MSDAFKADRAIRRVTFNPNKASPRETLTAPVPKLDDGVVLMPGSLSLIFEFNVSRALVHRLTVKFAGEVVKETDGYDLFKHYEDHLLIENERASMFREGI